MFAKFCALGLVATAAAVAERTLVMDPGTVASNSAAASIQLLPQTINGYVIADRWHNVRPDSVIEEGALYSLPNSTRQAANGGSVQLDFFRNSRRLHNAVICSVIQGERLQSEALHAVKTRTGQVTFDVAFLSSDSQLRLVAATECGGDGCTESSLLVSAPWKSWDWGAILAPDRSAVVPASIVLVRQHLEGQAEMAAAEKGLLDEFEQMAADLDLLPAQRLAAALDVHGAT
jgi:hypothetical protein